MSNLPYPVEDRGLIPEPDILGIPVPGVPGVGQPFTPTAPSHEDHTTYPNSYPQQSNNLYQSESDDLYPSVSDGAFSESFEPSSKTSQPYYPPNAPYSSANAHYPQSNQQYHSADSPYQPNNQNYPPTNVQYPPLNPPYQPGPAQNNPYQPNNSPYQPINQPYPGSNASYPQSNQPYPPSNSQYPQAPYQPPDIPYPTGNSAYPQHGQPQQTPYPYNSSNQTPYPPIPNPRQPGHPPYGAPGGQPGQPPYSAPGGQSVQPPYNSPVYPPSLPYSQGQPSQYPPYAQHPPGGSTGHPPGGATGYPPASGTGYPPASGGSYPPYPGASPASPSGGNVYSPGGQPASPPGGNVYTSGDSPSNEYQEFNEGMVSSNSKDGKLREGLKKLIMKSETVQAGVKIVGDIKKDPMGWLLKPSGRPSHFTARDDGAPSPTSPGYSPRKDPGKDYKQDTTYTDHVEKKDMKTKKFKNQDYHRLKSELRGRKFEDPEFRVERIELGGGGQGYMRTMYRQNEIQWKRPGEIVSDPVLFDKNINRFDINQGEIGDCWFLASLAILAEKKDYFKKVVPYSSSRAREDFQAGIFRFRFFSFNKWTEVVIDDRLPTRNGKLIYLKSGNPNEFWSPLLEKAYAKMYGGYKQLEGGLSIEASVDFTGGIPEVINLAQLNSGDKKSLFDYMKEAAKLDAFMTCSLSNSHHQRDGVNKGLQARHAYTITKVTELRGAGRKSIPLIRLRNPHGNHNEWKGDWSDKSSQWNQISTDQKRSLNLTIDNDGEFYMNFDRDFLMYFGEVEIVHQEKNASGVGDIQGKMTNGYTGAPKMLCFRGKWKSGVNAGGCGNDGIRNFATNPQFMFSIQRPSNIQECPVVISLAQRLDERKNEHAIGFRVYKLKDLNTPVDETFLSYNLHVAKTDSYTNMREVGTRTMLKEGSYVVIPSTFHRNEQGEFLLRLFFDSRWSPREESRPERGGGTKIPIQRSFYSKGGYIYSPRYGLNAMPGEQMPGDELDSSVVQASPKKQSICEKSFEVALNFALSRFKKITHFALAKILYHWPKDSESEKKVLTSLLASLNTQEVDRKTIQESTNEEIEAYKLIAIENDDSEIITQM